MNRSKIYLEAARRMAEGETRWTNSTCLSLCEVVGEEYDSRLPILQPLNAFMAEGGEINSFQFSYYPLAGEERIQKERDLRVLVLCMMAAILAPKRRKSVSTSRHGTRRR